MSVLNEKETEEIETKKDTLQIDMSSYVDRAKTCNIDREALAILLRLEIGDDFDIIRDMI